MFFDYKMNYDDKKHVIEYIEGNKVKQFKVPEKDYGLKFNKMSYNDVLMYIKLTKEELKKGNEANTLKYKPLKTVAAKTKDYFAQDIKLMSQVERLKKIAEFLISDNIKELKEFISSDVFNDDPIIKNVMTLLNNKGYTHEEIMTLMKRRKEIDLYSSEIENCIVKDGETHYSFEDYTFKNTLGDLLDLSNQINVLQEYTIFVPIDNSLNYNFVEKTKDSFISLNSLIFGKIKFNSIEGRKIATFLTEKYVVPSTYATNYVQYYLSNTNDFLLDNSKIPFYFYCYENKKIYLNIKILYYLLQFNNSFKNNNYKFVVEKLKNGVINNVIFIAGSVFDLDNVINSLNEKDDKEKDYYDEYVKLMSEIITKFFNKQFTPIIYKLETKQEIKPISESKPLIESFTDETDDDEITIEKEGEGLNFSNSGQGLFSFRRDTKETLQLLLDRIVKLENKVESQNEQIRELKLGIKSINQSLPDDKRKEVFGNYFSNSLQTVGHDSERIQENGALDSIGIMAKGLNPDKVYPKITFSEFRKLYNKL